MFDKAPDKAQCISALLRNILYEHKIYRPKDANNQNDEAKKELQAIIEALHCSIKNVDKIVKECYKFDSLDKKQFISIVETYSHQKICEPSRFRMFSATSILDTETASEEKNDISEVVMSST
ncbi:hypothetical protein [Legionella fairfieldensis]|uniref:hypothetical protein n=1 Tax=Legionella fairfieldensis TaxID=45064 RepID=UPI0010411BB0|nr:hypothetical protein [Legionella fairfieldensis]